MLHYLRVIKKEISEEKSQYPKIQDIMDGIDTIAIKFKQRSISV